MVKGVVKHPKYLWQLSFGIFYLARSVDYEGQKKKLHFKEIAIDGRQDIFMHIKKTI